MPRPLKKSHYSKKITQELLDQIAEVFGEAYNFINILKRL